MGGSQKYLRFQWKDNLYEFQSLPFGLSSAPRVFTKLLKPVLARFRHQGMRLIMYLDDMLVMAQEQGETREPFSSDNIPSRAVGFCGQQGEVATDT